MENFERVNLTEDNFDEEHEKLASFSEHIKNIDEERKRTEMVNTVRGLKDSENKKIATFLLGQLRYNDQENHHADLYKLVSYVNDYDKTEQQGDVSEYLDQMLDHEEDVTLEARNPEIDSLMYAYEVGVDMSKTIEGLTNPEGRYRHLYAYDVEAAKNKATVKVVASYEMQDALYFPCQDIEGLEKNAEYIKDCYEDYLQSMEYGEKLLEEA